MADDPQYNWIYKKLVKGPDDVAGALAYVLYKNAKIEYIESFFEERKQQPSDVDLAAFHRLSNLSDTLEGYRERAENLLETFLDNVLAEKLIDYREELRDDAIVKAVRTSFWKGVGQNVVAGLVSTLMTFGFVLGVWMYTEGTSKILTGAVNKLLSTDAQAQQPPTKPPAK